jgi:hypothetical protein
VIGFTDALSYHFTSSTLSFFTLAAKPSAEGYGSLFAVGIRLKLFGRSQQRPPGGASLRRWTSPASAARRSALLLPSTSSDQAEAAGGFLLSAAGTAVSMALLVQR